MTKVALKPDFAKDSNEPTTGFTNNYTKLRYSNIAIFWLSKSEDVQPLYFFNLCKQKN